MYNNDVSHGKKPRPIIATINFAVHKKPICRNQSNAINWYQSTIPYKYQ